MIWEGCHGGDRALLGVVCGGVVQAVPHSVPPYTHTPLSPPFSIPLLSGSGIQTDCKGDVLFLEHFYTSGGAGIGHDVSINTGACYDNTHAACGFTHPGNPPVHFPYYMSGRWNAGSVNDRSQGNVQGASWLMGVAGLDAWKDALQHCVGCPSTDGKGLLVNPYLYASVKPDTLVVGNLQPYVCVEDHGEWYDNVYYPNLNKPWSTVAGKPDKYKCWSDDEVGERGRERERRRWWGVWRHTRTHTLSTTLPPTSTATIAQAWNGDDCRKAGGFCEPNWNTQVTAGERGRGRGGRGAGLPATLVVVTH